MALLSEFQDCADDQHDHTCRKDVANDESQPARRIDG